MLVASITANEDEVVHGPCDWIDRMFFHALCIVQQGDVRGEVRVRAPPQSATGQYRTKHLPKRLQSAQSVITDQHKWIVSGASAKTDAAIENDLEWRHSKFREV